MVRHYRLVYLQPYEYDDDSSEGIGDHDIAYSEMEAEFVAENDTDARKQVRDFLGIGGLQFGWHLGSPKPGYYPRRFKSLVEFKLDRRVKYDNVR